MPFCRFCHALTHIVTGKRNKVYAPRNGKMCLRGICEQRRSKSACAPAQSDQGFRCPLTELLPTKENINVQYSKDLYQIVRLRCPKDTFSNGAVQLQRQKKRLRTCAPSEDSDQPAHSRSLIRIFTWCILDSQGCKVSSCEHGIL